MASEPSEPNEQAIPARAKPPPEPEQIVRPEVVHDISWRLAKLPKRPPSPGALLATIRRLSKERKIAYLDHGEFRLETRFKEMGFDVFDLCNVLEHGVIVGKIQPGKKEGEWKVKLAAALEEGAGRKMGVVAFVVRQKRLLIKTVEWED